MLLREPQLSSQIGFLHPPLRHTGRLPLWVDMEQATCTLNTHGSSTKWLECSRLFAFCFGAKTSCAVKHMLTWKCRLHLPVNFALQIRLWISFLGRKRWGMRTQSVPRCLNISLKCPLVHDLWNVYFPNPLQIWGLNRKSLPWKKLITCSDFKVSVL